MEAEPKLKELYEDKNGPYRELLEIDRLHPCTLRAFEFRLVDERERFLVIRECQAKIVAAECGFGLLHGFIHIGSARERIFDAAVGRQRVQYADDLIVG